MGKADRLTLKKQADWKTVLALALSAYVTQGLESETHAQEIADARKSQRIEQSVRSPKTRLDKIENAKQVAVDFLENIDALYREEVRIKHSLSQDQDPDKILRGLRERSEEYQLESSSRKGEEGAEFKERRRIESRAAVITSELVSRMRELKGMYPNRRSILEQLPKDIGSPKNMRANEIMKEMVGHIKHILSLPPDIREQMIIHEIILMSAPEGEMPPPRVVL